MSAARSLISKGKFLRQSVSSLSSKPFSSCLFLPNCNITSHQKFSIRKFPNSIPSAYQVRCFIPSGFQLEENNISDGANDHQIGYVKWFDTTRGYGFIVCDALDRDIFVHQTDIIRQGFRFLDEGDKVKFYIEKDQNGKMKAKGVTDKDGNEFMEGHPSRGY